MATPFEPAAVDQPSVIRFGGFELDLQSGVLSKNGTKNRLQGQPLQLLELLLEQPGQMVTREHIQQRLWPDGTVVEFEHSVNAAVKRLRAALDDDAEKPTFIETIPRRGYRFIAHVENCALPASAAVERHLSLFPTVFSAKPEPQFLAERRPIARGLVVSSVVIALLVVTFLMIRSHANQIAERRIRSLAVLPLKNLSGDPAQEYLADGMTEALIGRLARIQDLHVISRTSVMRFKDTQLSVPEIAKTLGVDAIVEGSVIRDGNRIRVNAQLIRAATDDHFWSESYDRDMQDILLLQSDVAQAVARRVEVSISQDEHARVTGARHVSPEVYESYLKGEDEFEKGNGHAGFEKSIAYFQEAINRDPTFAPAYVGMGAAWSRLGTPLGGAPLDEARPKIVEVAEKAIELDPQLAEPHDLLAGVYENQWLWQEAETEFRKALELDPNDVGAQLGLARWLLYHGRTDEALEWSQRAGKLDPFGLPSATHAWILFHARRYDDAIRELHKVRTADPNLAVAHWYLGYALTANGQPDQAIISLEKAASLTHGSPAVLGVLVRAYAHAGRRTEALRLLEQLKQRQQTSYVPSAAFVNAYLGLGDNEQALAWLERGYQEQSGILALLKVHPYFDPLRGDARFQQLVHRVGLD